MKFFIAALLLSSTSAIVVRKQGNGSGEPIPICNGMNNNHCTEADDVIRTHGRRPHKAPAIGDPDYVALQLDAEDYSTGEPIPICNGANQNNCTEASEVIIKARRRRGKVPAIGDSDYKA